jgi:hypothetical protein
MARFTQPTSGDGSGLPGPQGDPGPQGNAGADGSDGLDSLFLGTWNSVTEFLAAYQGGPVGLADGDWWAFVKDNENPNKIYVVREDPNSATGWVIDDNEHFVLPAGADGSDGADGADGANGADALWDYLGEYNGGIIYGAGAVVTYDGQLWYRNVYTSAGYVPGVGNTYWDLLAAKGVDGADGQDGAPGNDGAPGAQGDPGSPGLVYLGNYVSGNGYIANLAVVKGSDNNLYIATSSGGLGDPVGNSAEWSIFLPKGADGSQGEPGPQGDPGTAGGFGASASYYSTADQGPQTSVDTIQAFTYNNTDWQTGVLLQNNTGNVNIWLSKNGSPVTNTNTKVNLNSNNHYLVAAWNFFVDAAADDYYELIWSSSSTNTSVQYDPEVTINGNVHPAIPSIILTVNQVG